jgi:hypothetical protein
MSETAVPVRPAPAPSRRRWVKRIAIGLLAVILLAAGGILLFLYLADREWHEAVAEADRLDPGWRFEELEAKRAPVADDENAALRVLAATDLVKAAVLAQNGFPVQDTAVEQLLKDQAPNAPLTPKQHKDLTAMIGAAGPALAEARKLKDLRNGRYPPAKKGPDGLPGLGQHVGAMRLIAAILTYDALLRADDGDADGALESDRALMNVARSCGDEPDYLAQLTRMELRSAACRAIERTLAQGQPSAANLAALQRLLEDEEKQPLFLHGARSLRAWLDQTLEVVSEGQVGPKEVPSWAFSGLAINMRPVTLRVSTRVVEIAKLPVEEQGRALQERGVPKQEEWPRLAGVWIKPKVEKVVADLSRGQFRSQAELRCAVVAIAAERYRKDHGAWPAALADLVPAYLGAVPIDPFDGQPLRYRKLADGVVIYSVGPDGTDDQGTLDRVTPGSVGSDLGVQLWDVERRASPPAK